MTAGNAVNSGVRAAARTIAAFALALCAASGAFAQNLGTFFTDDWWNPAESGWGLVVAHQQNFMFATFFIYRADGTPYWVTGQLQKVGTAGLVTFPQAFTGPVYETHGPSFGGPFDPSLVTIQPVGTATFTASGANAATLQYSINGTNVSKTVERQTLSLINYSGQFQGGLVTTLSQCSVPANNGVTVAQTGNVTITQSGSSITLFAQLQSENCTFTGTYSQTGSIGAVNGTYTCTAGEAGPFSMFDMQWTAYGVSAGISAKNQVCQIDGYTGGITGQHFQ
jgi:hypothetical protein